MPRRKGRPESGAAPGEKVASSSPSAGSPEQNEKREAILNNVIQLIQSAAITPGKKHFEIAVQNLNEYFEQGTRPSDYYLSVDSRKFLQSQPFIGSAEAVRELESSTFGIMDSRHIEDCMLYSDIAHRVAGERMPGESGDLPRIRRLFDWTVRNIQLVPPGALAPPGAQQAYARPYDVLLRGMATELPGLDPGWSERGWLFMSLCRQLNIDVGLISYVPKRAPASIALNPASESAEGQPVIWICVALVDEKAYLFDQQLGIAIPDGKGDGVATLDEALADPRVLERLELPGQFPYPTTRAALLSAGKVTVMLDSSRGYNSPKMRLLQARLTGKNRTVLFRDPVEQARHFARVMRDRIGNVTLWALPYGVENLLFGDPRFTDATKFTLRPFSGDTPLLYARFTQLKGDLPEAMRKYVAMRFNQGALKADRKTPISADEQREIDVFATYFLALCHLEQKNADNASRLFQQLLNQAPEPDRRRREYCDMLRWGAYTNLGLIARDAGDIPTATRHLSEFVPTLQYHGNLWLARELVWRDPTSKTAPPLAPAPAPPVSMAAPLISPAAAGSLLAPPVTGPR
jgi:hypothetical protein